MATLILTALTHSLLIRTFLIRCELLDFDSRIVCLVNMVNLSGVTDISGYSGHQAMQEPVSKCKRWATTTLTASHNEGLQWLHCCHSEKGRTSERSNESLLTCSSRRVGPTGPLHWGGTKKHRHFAVLSTNSFVKELIDFC